MDSQDADGHRRQRTRGRDDNTRPTSPAKGACERSSIRMTSKQMPHQVSEYPSGHLVRLPQIQHWGAPRANVVVVRGLQRTP